MNALIRQLNFSDMCRSFSAHPRENRGSSKKSIMESAIFAFGFRLKPVLAEAGTETSGAKLLVRDTITSSGESIA
jgi:hypothetical protein